MLFANQRWVNACAHCATRVACNRRKQLNHAIFCTGRRNICCRNRANSFNANVINAYWHLECKRCQNRSLICCIKSFNVSCRIRLRVSLFLSCAQSRIKIKPTHRHLVKNVVCSSVYDSKNLRDFVTYKRLSKRTQNRDCACNRRLKA